MRWLLAIALFVACSPAQAVQPAPTEDPRVAAFGAERDAALLRASSLEADVKILAARLEAAKTTPTFSLWSSQMLLRGKHYTALGLPDTFTIRIRFSATTPVRTRIMTLDEYVRWRTTGLAEAIDYPPATERDFVFHDAEGCGAYVVVFDAAQDSLISPDLVITRAPNPLPTGTCAN